MNKVLHLLLIFFLFSNLKAEIINPAARLNKISLSLTGLSATIQDQKFALTLKDNDLEEFLNKKTDEYMTKPEYTVKFTAKVAELFRFYLPNSYQFTLYDKLGTKIKPRTNSTFHLIDSITKNNLSWDFLLTAKEYTLYPIDFSQVSIDQINLNDIGFFSTVYDLPSSYIGYIRDSENIDDLNDLKPIKIQFNENDPRIAGILTTPLFFERYTTTAINKNRRRAAQIFRIFLCDNMKATIPEKETIDPSLFDLFYPTEIEKNSKNNLENFTELEIKAVLKNNDSIHGIQSDCMVCHSKLDPLGQVFSTSPLSIGSQSSPGRLFYKNLNQEQINISVNNISELAKNITNQPDYLSCQVKRFWNWYIGEDIKLTKEREAELIQFFNSTNRKTNDFIKKLVLSSEFNQRQIPNEIKNISIQAESFLKRCQSCHNNSNDYFGPDLTVWPLGQNQDDPKDNASYWINQIYKKLDLENNSINYKMPPPPKEGGFIPTRIELSIIKKWIELGGPDVNGKKQVLK